MHYEINKHNKKNNKKTFCNKHYCKKCNENLIFENSKQCKICSNICCI